MIYGIICELVLNVPNVLVASTMDAMCPQGRYRKIKLLEFSVNALWTLCVIDMDNFDFSNNHIMHNLTAKSEFRVLKGSVSQVTTAAGSASRRDTVHMGSFQDTSRPESTDDPCYIYGHCVYVLFYLDLICMC